MPCVRNITAMAVEKYSQGERVKGKVSRVADFGAFVELEPGVEGLIHVSEMSWTKKNVRAQDIVKVGDQVGTMWVINEGLKPGQRVIAEGAQNLRPGTQVSPKPFVEGN